MKTLMQKTCLLLLLLSVTVSGLAYACIAFFLPYATVERAADAIAAEAEVLVSQLRTTKQQDSEALFLDFLQETGAELTLLDAEGKRISLFTFAPMEAGGIEGNRYPFHFADGKGEYILVVGAQSSHTAELKQACFKSIPFVAAILLLLSFFCAWIFSHYTTKPILRIQKIAAKMANLDFSWYCPDVRRDEIGVLSENINELSDKLYAALEELHQRNDCLMDEIVLEREQERRRMLFFAGVSHELKTPIAIVIGQLEGMQANIGVYKNHEKYLARCAEILESLNCFLQEVLAVSYLNLSEQTEPKPMALTDLLRVLSSEYAVYAEAQQITIIDVLASDIFVYGDEKLFQKAFGNLVGNAVTYTPEHGTVTMSLTSEADIATVTITNSPAHIPEQQLPHLFEAFYRGVHGAKQGSGLGLYMTRMIFETYHVPHRIENTADGVTVTVQCRKASI